MKSINNIEEYFLGSLYSSNYKNISIDEQKKILLEKKIYVLDDDVFWDSIKIEYNEEPHKASITENEFQLGDSFIYLDNKYKINDLFLKELFKYTQADVYASIEQPLEIKIKEINLHAKYLENFSDVNEFYKTQYREQYDKIKENEYFFIYNDPKAWNYDDWEFFVTEEVSNNTALIETHLFSEYGYSSFEQISLKWEDLYYRSEIMNFLREKLNSTDNTSLSKLIFRDNGEEIFNYILLNYQGEKNQAFYSYLYYFLKDNLKKIMLENEDSSDYKKYVIDNGYLDKYGRMQKARSSSKKKHTEMPELFQKILLNKI